MSFLERMAKEKAMEAALFGQMRMGTVVSVDPKRFRCQISYPDSLGGSANVSLNPSPLYGYVPTVGTTCIVYDKPGWDKKLVTPLFEQVSSDLWSREDQLENGVDMPGLVDKNMLPGDVVIGRGGRGRFRTGGDILFATLSNRAKVDLIEDLGRARVTAFSFDFNTFGNGIRVYTPQTDPETFGDEFIIERNVPASGSSDLEEDPVPTNITRMKIDTNGSFKLDVGSLTAELEISSQENIRLANTKSALAMNSAGDVLLNGPASVLYMTNDGQSGLQSLGSDFNIKSQLNLYPDGDISLFNDNADVKIDKDGDIDIDGDFLNITGATGVNIVSDDITHNNGTEPIVLGNKFKALMSQFISLVAAITVPTGVGPSGPPVNATQIQNLAQQLDDLLSQKSKVA